MPPDGGTQHVLGDYFFWRSSCETCKHGSERQLLIHRHRHRHRGHAAADLARRQYGSLQIHLHCLPAAEDVTVGIGKTEGSVCLQPVDCLRALMETGPFASQRYKPSMFYALSWFFVLGLFAFWSLAARAIHAVAMWAIAHSGSLSGAVTGVGSLRPPEWLAQWVPPELVQAMASLLSGLASFVDKLLQSAPALAGDLTVAIWVIWGLGCALLVLLGVGLHVFIARLRRGNSGNGGNGDQSGPVPQAPRQVPP